MPTIFPKKPLLSLFAKKKFGRPFGLGRLALGFANFGDSGDWLNNGWIHKDQPTNLILEPDKLLTGIYQTRHSAGREFTAQMEYYWPRNPRTVLQQAQRAKYAGGVAAWLLLTDLQKAVYNERVKLGHGSGYNLFVSEYLLSH